MKILSIITSGGRLFMVFTLLLIMCFMSCDCSQLLLINAKPDFISYTMDENNIRIVASTFGRDYFLKINSDSALNAQPNSFQYEFDANVVFENISFNNKKRRYNKKDFYCYDVIFRTANFTPSANTITLKIIPNDYIQYKGKRVIDDTLYINLNPNEYKKLKNMR